MDTIKFTPTEALSYNPNEEIVTEATLVDLEIQGQING